MKTITLQELKDSTKPLWIETKVKGQKWNDTLLNTFSGKRINIFGDRGVSFKVNGGTILVCEDRLSVRVKQWNKDTMMEEYTKILF